LGLGHPVAVARILLLACLRRIEDDMIVGWMLCWDVRCEMQQKTEDLKILVLRLCFNRSSFHRSSLEKFKMISKTVTIKLCRLPSTMTSYNRGYSIFKLPVIFVKNSFETIVCLKARPNKHFKIDWTFEFFCDNKLY
jgi:hypothetical protein